MSKSDHFQTAPTDGRMSRGDAGKLLNGKGGEKMREQLAAAWRSTRRLEDFVGDPDTDREPT